MSVHVSSWVFKNSPAEKADRLVLLVLADHANGDGGGAYPSVTTIQCEARVRGRSTVQGALRTLERAGAIDSTGADESGTTIYRVSMDMAEQDWSGVYQPWEDPYEKHRRRRTSRASTRGGTESVPLAGGTEKSAGGAQFSAPGGTDSGPKPSKEPSREPKEKAGQKEDPSDGDRWQRVLDDLSNSVPEHTFKIWLSRLELAGRDGNTVRLRAPDEVATWARQRYLKLIEQVAMRAFGPAVEIEILVSETEAAREGQKKLQQQRSQPWRRSA